MVRTLGPAWGGIDDRDGDDGGSTWLTHEGRRRSLLAGGLGIGLLGALAACGDDVEKQSGAMWSTLGERPKKHADEPTVHGDPITPEDPRGLECSRSRFTLTRVSRRAVLEPEDARIISGKAEGPSDALSAPTGRRSTSARRRSP